MIAGRWVHTFSLFSWCLAVVLSGFITQPLLASDRESTPASLDALADQFWQWRARWQPFSRDDIPRIERPSGPQDWSAASIEQQKATLADFERQWGQIDAKQWTVAQQVDYRLIGSALARVRWELEINARWQRDPEFYLDQTLTALLEVLVQPPPFDTARSRVILERMRAIPGILEDGKANLRPVRPFAELAIADLGQIRLQLEQVQHEVAPMLRGDSPDENLAGQFQAATAKAIDALESYRAWLQSQLSSMNDNAAIGRANYEFFLQQVALIPYSPGQLLEISRQEWARSVAFEQYERQRNQGLPELAPAATLQAELETAQKDETAIRRFLEEKGILTVPANVGHYSLRPAPGYLEALGDFGELDDFTGPSRLKDDGVRWVSAPSPQLGYFWLATAKDPRPDMVHEGVPGHYFQMCVSWRHPDTIRRHYYDSGANEGIGFYAEEMMMQAGLFDDSPRTREIIYNFMRLRALRVEVDVKLALGELTIPQAAEYLAQHVPMDKKSAAAEAALFATTPGQAISYQIGKSQILDFLAAAKVAQGARFSLRSFQDFVWQNGNVPITLQRWEYLGDGAGLQAMDREKAASH